MTIADRNELRQPAYGNARGLSWLIAELRDHLWPWSVFEIFVRLDAKPYVKEGPWWGHLYRRATVMDMICYVSFKNLLIGAVLFIGLRTLDIVQV